MRIHHVRNATFVIETDSSRILIDPSLSDKSTLPPFTFIKHPPAKNPTVALPGNAKELIKDTTLCLVTHSQKWGIEPLTHTDHFDKPGKAFLMVNKIPVVCPINDVAYMEKNGLTVEAGLTYWQAEEISCGRITAVPALHGHNWTHNMMANGAGFYLELPDEPSIYISGDTVYTKDVERALEELKPDVAVVAAGSASLDVGGAILMPMEEIITFTRKAPKKVIANHMEALNHCPTTRAQLKGELEKQGLLEKTYIPENGESFTIELD